MKITINQLRRIIKEEVSMALGENVPGGGIDSMARRLRSFDWQYDYSDDPMVYDRSRRALEQIRKDLSTMSVEDLEMLMAHPDVTGGSNSGKKLAIVKWAMASK